MKVASSCSSLFDESEVSFTRDDVFSDGCRFIFLIDLMN